MKKTATLLTTALVAGLALAAPGQALAQSSGIGSYDVKQLSNEGRDSCRALGDSGYTATARGILNGAGGRNGDLPFNVRVCFETASQCERFAGRIHQHISDILVLRHASCSPRG